MTPRIVLYLAAAALITVTGAVLAYRSTHVFVPQAGVGERVLPGLAEKANNVKRIRVEQGTDKLELELVNGAWQTADTNYPASSAKVKKAIVGLINLTKLEAKTANTVKYPLIEVDDPGKKGGRGRLITLAGADGKEIAKIVLGKTAPGKAGPGKDAQYVRPGGSETSWLAMGSVGAGPAITSWVEPRFIKLNVDKVMAGRIEHKDGEIIEVKRGPKDAKGISGFELLNIPEGRKARTATTIKFAATDWANLDLVEVRPLKTSADKPDVTMDLTMDTGMKVRYSLVTEDGKGWVSVAVTEKGSDQKLADEVEKRVKGWQFALADYKRKQLIKRTEDLLEKQK